MRQILRRLRLGWPIVSGSVFTLFLAGCSTPTGTNTLYVESIDPALYTSFWASDLQKLDQQAQFRIGPTLEKRCHQAVVTGFREKGMIEASKLEADLHVYVLISLQLKNDAADEILTGGDYRVGEGVIRPSTLRAGGPRTARGEYHKGELFIDLVDRKTAELIWRGWLDKNLFRDPSNVDPNELEAAILDLIQSYPPPGS